MTGTLIFQQFVAFDPGCGQYCEFQDEVRAGSPFRYIDRDPRSVYADQLLADEDIGLFDPVQNTAFIDGIGAYCPAMISFGPLSEINRCSPQQQSAMFLMILLRHLAIRRPEVAAGPKALHRFVNVTKSANPILGYYAIFRDGLSVIGRETVAILD